MLRGCSSFINIDLSNFNTQNIKEMNNILFGCNSLIKKIIKNFN